MGQGGWTNDAITTLVIPTGATTGARVVINGLTGEIDIYDSLNNLVGRLSPAGLALSPDLTDVNDRGQVFLPPVNTSGQAEIFLQPAADSGHIYQGAVLIAEDFHAPGFNPYLDIFSPLMAGQLALVDGARILLVSRSTVNGAVSTLDHYADQIQFYDQGHGQPDIKYGGASQPRGLQHYQAVLGAGVIGTTETLQFTLSGETFRNGRVYQVRVRYACSSGTASEFIIWRVRKTNLVGAIVTQQQPSVGSTTHTVTDTCLLTFGNYSGSDIAVTIVVTVEFGTAGTVPGVVVYAELYDIGSTADYTAESAIT